MQHCSFDYIYCGALRTLLKLREREMYSFCSMPSISTGRIFFAMLLIFCSCRAHCFPLSPVCARARCRSLLSDFIFANQSTNP
jgi:hypothetical protein